MNTNSSSSNDDVLATLTQWLIQEADILPTRASSYSTHLIAAGVGSVSRLSKKMSKTESFLVGLGIDQDDSDEITSAVSRFRNVERARKLKSKQSGPEKRTSATPQMLSIDTTTSNNTSNNITISTTTSSDADCPITRLQAVTTASTPISSSTPAPAATTAATSSTASTLAASDSSSDFTDVPLDASPIVRVPALGRSSSNGVPPARPQSLRSSPPIPMTSSLNQLPPKLAAAFGTATTTASTAAGTTGGSMKKPRSLSMAGFKRSSSSLSTPNLLDLVATPKRINEEDPAMLAVPSSPGFNASSVSGFDVDNADDVAVTSAASLRMNMNTSPHIATKNPNHVISEPTPVHIKSPITRVGMHISHDIKALSNLKRISWSGSPGLGSHHQTKEEHDTDTAAREILMELNLSIDKRSEPACLAALTRLQQYRTDDMRYYQDALSKEGACKAVSVVLSLFSASSRVCLETVKTITALCQNTDTDKQSFHSENTEGLGGHGTCFPVIRILVNPAHAINAELVAETCRAIGILAMCASNNKAMTNGGCCQSLVALTKEVGEEREAVVAQAVIALRHLSARAETMSLLLTLDVCEAMVGALSLHQHHEKTALDIIGTIIAVASSSREACCRLGEVGVCKTVLDTIRCDDDHASVFEIALVAIEVLLSVEGNLPRLLQASICDTLATSLQKHAVVENIATNACRVIQLFATNAIIRSKLNSAGMCEIMRHLFSLHIGTPVVMQACCAAVATLAADHKENKSQLTSAGVCEFVIMTIQKYSVGDTKKLMGSTLPAGSELVVWQASWALRMLTVGMEENRGRLETAHVCEALNAAVHRHANCPEPMIQVFRTLIVLASDEELPLVSHMGTAGICKSVVRAMHKNQGNATVCKLGCQVIVRLAGEENNRPILFTVKASEEVSSIIMRHASTDTHLTEWGCKALYSLCCDDEISGVKMRTGGEIEAVVWAIQRQGHFVEVAEWSTKVFAALASIPVNAKKFGGSGGCEAIIGLTKTHSRVATVCETACKVIHYLALNGNNRAWLGASGGCDIMGTVLHHHIENGDVCTSASFAVGHLACNHEGNSARLRAIGMCEKVLDVLKRHVNHEACADATCYAVFELCKFKDNVLLMSDMQVCEKVIEAMVAHSEVDAVDKHALQALQRLSLPEYHKNFKVLSNKDTVQHIVNVLCSQVVTTSCDVSIEGCKLIDQLAVNDSNKTLLGDAGACRALVTMLRIHKNHSALLAAHVSVSCAKLSMGCTQNVARLMDQSACELFLGCVDDHKNCDNTLISVFQCLFYLSSSPMARSLMLVKEDMFKSIVRVVPKVKHDGRGVFWCLRLLLALAQDQDSRDMAHKTHAYKVIPATALLLKDNRHVMLAALQALEALLTGYTAEDECFIRLCSSDTCELINHALDTFATDVLIATTACHLVHMCVGKDEGGLVSGVSQVPGSPGKRKAAAPTPSSSWIKGASAWAALKGKLFSSGNNSTTAVTSNTTPSGTSSGGSSVRKSLVQFASAVSTSQNSFDDDSSSTAGGRHDEKTRHMRAKLGLGGACAGVLKVISGNTEDAALVSAGCDALLALSLEVSNIGNMGGAGAVDVLVVVLRRYGHCDKQLLTALCQLIAALASVNKSHASQLGVLGVCDLLTTALSVHHSSAEASEAACRAIYHLSHQNIPNQNRFGDAGVTLALKKVLQLHYLNLNVSLSAISAVYAVLCDHFNNSSKFAAITTPQVFLDLLTEFMCEQEVVRHTLWVLNCVRKHSSNKILVIEPCDDDDEPRGEEEMLNQGGTDTVMALSQQRVRDIVSAIQQHSHDDTVALYGCELVSSILIWADSSSSSSGRGVDTTSITADGRVFLLNDSHTQLTNYFDTAGTCELMSQIFIQHGGNEAIASSALHAVGLLLRAQANSVAVTVAEQRTFRETRMDHFGSLDETTAVIKLLQRYGPSSSAVLKYCTLVLGNILFGCDDDQQIGVIGDSVFVKALLGMLKAAVGDQGVARYGCVFISRLCVIDGNTASSGNGGAMAVLLMQAGAGSFLLEALQAHLTAPSVVEHALHALHALCCVLPSASMQLGSSDVCQTLGHVFTQYPVTSINEPVAFALCRAVATLADDNGSNCVKFGKAGACEDLVKQLIHFLNGPYIAIIRDTNSRHGGKSGDGSGDGRDGRAVYCELVALWSCRAIGSLAKDPATWAGQPERSASGVNENNVTLGEIGGCEAIAQVMKVYSGEEDITQAALWAALNLCQDSGSAGGGGDSAGGAGGAGEANAGKLLRAGAGRCVTSAAEHFPDNSVLIGWATQVLELFEGTGGK